MVEQFRKMRENFAKLRAERARKTAEAAAAKAAGASAARAAGYSGRSATVDVVAPAAVGGGQAVDARKPRIKSPVKRKRA